MKCVRASRLSLPRRPWGIALCLAAASLTIASPACRQPDADPASPPASQSAPAVQVALATPEEAARSVLTCLHAQWAARQRDDRAAAELYREQLRAMAADNVILARHRGIVRRPSQTPDVLDTFVQGWGPIIGFYADGLQLDRIQVPDLSAEQDQVFVRVPAASRRGEAIIRLECFRGPDRRWRVARIDFEPTASPPSPTTAPSP